MFGFLKSGKTRERERSLVQALREALEERDFEAAQKLLRADFRATSPQQGKTIASAAQFIETIAKNQGLCQTTYFDQVTIEGSEYLLRFTAEYPDGRKMAAFEFYRVKKDQIVSMIGNYGTASTP